MLKVIVKLQRCTTIPGRFAFVSKTRERHGIAAGTVSFYEITASNWTMVRRAVAGYDTSGRTMGFSEVRPETVESFTGVVEKGTAASVRPLNMAQILRHMGVGGGTVTLRAACEAPCGNRALDEAQEKREVR